MYDLKIVNGLIISGVGGERPYHGCLAVKDGRIAAVGADVSGEARRVLDAAGQVVCPGFIDLHTHCAAGDNLNYLKAGVTTVVTGNCGFGRVPDELPGRGTGPAGTNIAYLSGHNTVRLEVMGNVNRAPTPPELDQMAALVADDMVAGAMGFSAGMTYVPGSYAETSELIVLARVAADAGGIYTVHVRCEGEGILDSIAETVRIGEEAGLPAHVSHIKLNGASVWGRSGELFSALDAARARGVDITWDQYPYTASCGRILLLFSPWLQEGTPDELRSRFLDPVTRARAKEDLVSRIELMYDGDGSRVMIATAPQPVPSGCSLADVAEAAGRTASVADLAETVLDLVARYPEQTAIYCVFHSMDEGDVRRILRHPVTMVASDGWSITFGEGHHHPRQYGTCPRVLGRYARDEGLFPLEEAVRRMTSMPAARLGLTDRGVLAEGAWADIVVFDPETIRDLASFEDPHRYPAGIAWVIVNGEPVVDHGNATARRSGVFVSRPV